jgi:hypothetical protein
MPVTEQHRHPTTVHSGLLDSLSSEIHPVHHQYLAVESPSASPTPKCHPACADSRCTAFGGPPSTCLGHCSDGYVPSSLGGGCQVAHSVSFVAVLQNQPGNVGNCTSLNLTALTVPEVTALRQHIAAPLEADWRKLHLQGLSCSEIQDAVTLRLVKVSVVASFTLSDLSGPAALLFVQSLPELSNRLSSVLVARRVLAVINAKYSKLESPCFATCETCLDLSRETCLTCQPGFSLSVTSGGSVQLKHGRCYATNPSVTNSTNTPVAASHHRSSRFPVTAQLVAGVLGGVSLVSAALVLGIWMRKRRFAVSNVQAVIREAGDAAAFTSDRKSHNPASEGHTLNVESPGPRKDFYSKPGHRVLRQSSKPQRKPDRDRIKWLTSVRNKRAARKKARELQKESDESVHSAEMMQDRCVSPLVMSSRSKSSSSQQRSIVEHGGEVLQAMIPVHSLADPNSPDNLGQEDSSPTALQNTPLTPRAPVFPSRHSTVAFVGADYEPEWQDYATLPPRSFRLDDGDGGEVYATLRSNELPTSSSLRPPKRSAKQTSSRRKSKV